MKTAILLIIAALIMLGAVPARAESTPERAVFALVVTSNKSAKLSRPDLHYADDDGARYYEVFKNLAPGASVTLLTAFDRDSAKLFPDLVRKASAPSVAGVRAAFAEMARKVTETTARGVRADFYFVFAGHGDVEEGRGFVELEDGRLVSDDLTSLVASVPATRAHVILDSCNSFFVINARKPGGRRFATAAEAGERLNRSLPNVGVFLSTSAEAETFEWSELGAGIFSHAVRSGLSGAADANRDGDVTYEELAAFVATATKDVKNPRFRPNVFARGPSGKNGEALVSLAQATARLTISKGVGRITIRDADELPWIDAHFDGRAETSLYVPARIASKGATASFGDERRKIEPSVDGDGLALAPAEATVVAARGPSDIFKHLFAQPFGADEVARYRAEVAAEAPAVYGVAGDDVTRMHELLRQASENARADRYVQALTFGSVGTFVSGVALQSAVSSRSTGAEILFAYGGVAFTFAGWSLLRTSREEEAFAWFKRERFTHGATPDLMVGAEARLLALARRDREERLFWRYFGIAYSLPSIALTIAFSAEAARDDRPSAAVFWGTAAFGIAAGFALPVIGTFSPTRTERLAELWEKDPARARLEAGAASPITIRPSIGLGSFGLTGTF